jgi:uncharacterized protein (TIGR02677 family)
VQWGNLRGDPDTSRVTTIEDFHRPRFLYQLTREGEAVERALAAYDEHLGRRGSLQAVALADIAAQLRALDELARQSNPDSARVSLLPRDLVGRFTDLADNAQAFMGSLQRRIDLYDADVETFRAYKDQLVEYIERFIKDLVTVGAEIASLLEALEHTGVARLLVVMTSEREWGCYPEVPGLAIAQLSRVDGVAAVLVTHWEWDGAARVPVDRPRAAPGAHVPSAATGAASAQENLWVSQTTSD